jgi:biopolymer transport protein ExbB
MTNGAPRSSRAWRVSGPMMLVIVLFAALWPGPAAAWWNDQWSLRKKITIDTGASGAGVSDAIGSTPVLVRLHAGNFRFGSAKEDGGDLRFVAADDKTPLKHHVEKYDSLLGEALVWVSIADLKPGTKNEIWLYYGNPKAPTAVDAKGTYDEDTLLVYHFADRGTPAQDVSAWANSAQSAVPVADGAIIGQGARLDGQTALMLPGSPSLVVAEGGEMTWSVWLKMAAPQPRAVLFARQEGPNGMIIGLDNGVPFVEVTNAGSTQRGGDGAPITPGTWRHLAVVAKNGQIAVYVDGNPFSTLAANLPTMTGTAQVGGVAATAAAAAAPGAAPATETSPAAAPTAGPAAGTAPAADAAAPAAPTAAAAVGFVGDIDELQIAKTARPAGFIKLAAIGQGPEQAKLISFSVDEETASWLSGYFAVILKSVTLDGWVVIGLLMIMMVISWIVMIDKIGYLGRQAKCNARFLVAFHDDASEFSHLEPAEPVGEEAAKKSRAARRSMKHSSLLRLYEIGVFEVRRRFAKRPGHHVLSDRTITAIRATLDTGYIKETQKLNRLMVMLTIAISGGPFLGLLGTVVGVMITFAAIAASGDVNVNAIAPGIAAALVATVAGLAVAIPALFGYNYLTTRIKDLSNDMQVFVDELLTQMAEEFQPPSEQVHQEAAE